MDLKQRIKRGFDIFFSLMVIVFLSPLFILLALLIKISSKGPIFYMSKRVGYKGNDFTCIKFRTMKHKAEKELGKLLKKPHFFKEWKRYQKLKKDPRITLVGSFLRKTSLDELPQFFNVLKGDLSVVGPRPLSKDEIEKFYGPKTKKMLSVKPGLTGLSQTSGRNLLSIKERIDLEQGYIESQSFLLDLLIIIKTIPQIFLCKGAY